MLNPENIEVVMPGGGSGGITIVDSLLDEIPNITAVTNVTDNGGHTRRIRTTLNLGPVGDDTQQMAVRIRTDNPELVEVAQRWRNTFVARSKHNGDRASNHLLAEFANQHNGKIPDGIKDIETVLRSAGIYKGRVVPVSYQHTQIRTILAGGGSLEDESALDEFMLTAENYLAERIEFLDQLEPNSEAIEAFNRADVIIFPPGSRLGSIHAVLDVPGISEAIAESEAKLICFTNAVDVKGWKASQSLEYIASKAQRKIDLAIVDTPKYSLPDTYTRIHHYQVVPDIDTCKTYADVIVAEPVTRLYQLDGYPTSRHDGDIATSIIKDYLRSQDRLAA